MDKKEGEALKKLICVDGKTMRGNKRKDGKPNHILTAWSRENGFSLGQKVVDTKSNEITAIPELLEKIHAYIVAYTKTLLTHFLYCNTKFIK